MSEQVSPELVRRAKAAKAEKDAEQAQRYAAHKRKLSGEANSYWHRLLGPKVIAKGDPDPLPYSTDWEIDRFSTWAFVKVDGLHIKYTKSVDGMPQLYVMFPDAKELGLGSELLVRHLADLGQHLATIETLRAAAARSGESGPPDDAARQGANGTEGDGSDG